MKKNKNAQNTKAKTPQLSPIIFSENLRSRQELSHQVSKVKHVKIYRNTAYQSFLGEISLARKDEQCKILDWVKHNMIKGIYSNWNRLAPIILHYFRKQQSHSDINQQQLLFATLNHQELLKNLQQNYPKSEYLFQYDIPNNRMAFLSEEHKFKRTRENLNIILNILMNFFKNKNIIKSNTMVRKVVSQFSKGNKANVDIKNIASILYERVQLFNLLIDHQLILKQGLLYEAIQQPFKDLNLNVENIKSQTLQNITELLSDYFFQNTQSNLPIIDIKNKQEELSAKILKNSQKQQTKHEHAFSTGIVSPIMSVTSTPIQSKKSVIQQFQKQQDYLKQNRFQIKENKRVNNKIHQIRYIDSESSEDDNQNFTYEQQKQYKQFQKSHTNVFQRQRSSVEKPYKTRVLQKNHKQSNLQNDPVETLSKTSEDKKSIRSGRFNSINVEKYRGFRNSEQIQNLYVKLYQKNNFIFSRRNRLKRRKIKVSQLQNIDIDKILQQLPVKSNRSSNQNKSTSKIKIQTSQQRSSKQIFRKIRIESKRRSYRPTTNISSFSKQNVINKNQSIFNNKTQQIKDKRRKGRYQQQKTFLQNQSLQQLYQQIEKQTNFVKKSNLIKAFFIRIIREGYFDKPQFAYLKENVLKFIQTNENKHQMRYFQNINFNRSSQILCFSQPQQNDQIMPFLRALRAGIISQQMPKLAAIINQLKRPQQHILDEDWSIKIRASLSQEKLQERQFISKLLAKQTLLLNFASKIRRKNIQAEIGQRSI